MAGQDGGPMEAPTKGGLSASALAESFNQENIRLIEETERDGAEKNPDRFLQRVPHGREMDPAQSRRPKLAKGKTSPMREDWADGQRGTGIPNAHLLNLKAIKGTQKQGGTRRMRRPRQENAQSQGNIDSLNLIQKMLSDGGDIDEQGHLQRHLDIDDDNYRYGMDINQTLSARNEEQPSTGKVQVPRGGRVGRANAE